MVEPEITPNELVGCFKESHQLRTAKLGRDGINKFKAISKENRKKFLEAVIKFLSDEKEDKSRAWATTVLEMIGGEQAYEHLMGMIKNKTEEDKRKYLYSRFFALRALKNVSIELDRDQEFGDLLKELSEDTKEDYLVQAGAIVILAQQGDQNARSKVKDWIGSVSDNFWKTSRTLRALREFPLHFPEITEEVLRVLKSSKYSDIRYEAISVFASSGYKGNPEIVDALGDISKFDKVSYLRLKAVSALAEIKDTRAKSALLHSLMDENAEIRVQATKALAEILSKESAISAVIEEILRGDLEEAKFEYLVDSLRILDKDGIISTELLSKELEGNDKNRSDLARKILLELGGWSAVQKLSQRRITLEKLDELLTDSEDIIKETFEETIKQAQRNFYFALGVNILVVIIGISLILIAIKQVYLNPDLFENWVIPGAAGVFGLIINMAFNNPRKNAREDLTALMNVNVIFLGFLRQINEIDATFKQEYLESSRFRTSEMNDSVKKIQESMNDTLTKTKEYLAAIRPDKE